MKTLFFDFGNVVGFFDHNRAIAHLARHTERPAHTLEKLLYGGPIEDDYEAGKLSTAEYVALAKQVADLRCTDDEFLSAYVDIFWRNHEVCELLPRLKPNYRLVIASNTNDAHYRKYCEQFADVIELFDHLCPSHHAGARKPRDEYYAYCQQFAEAHPNECLFIDDVAKNIDAAKRHGWNTIHYKPGDGLIGKLKDFGITFASPEPEAAP